jgi:hypothetical protein
MDFVVPREGCPLVTCVFFNELKMGLHRLLEKVYTSIIDSLHRLGNSAGSRGFANAAFFLGVTVCLAGMWHFVPFTFSAAHS